MTDLLSLVPGEIHLWLAEHERIEDDRLHAAYRELLSDAERQQEPRFHFARDRRRFLVTRALVRTVLSRYACVAPERWTFAANAYGRPYAKEAVQSQLSFNLSHTAGMVALGVTRTGQLGVDVENFVAREVSMELASHFFCAREAEDLAAAPAHLRQYRFFEYWTFKEAYIKARGMGLQLPLDGFGFAYPDNGTVTLSIEPRLGDEASRWKFWQCLPLPDCLLAVCAERIDRRIEQPPAVRLVVPMDAEAPLAVEFTRVSK